MKILYKKLVEVIIRHDYYLESVDTETSPNAGWSFWTEGYDIRRDLEIVPTAECQRLLQDLKIVFKTTARGFILYARVQEFEQTAPDPTLFYSFAFIEADSKFSFLLKPRNPYFSNYTNLRLTGDGPFLYYFNNRSDNLLTDQEVDELPAPIAFLSRPMPEPDPDFSNFQLGDLVLRNDRVIEALTTTTAAAPTVSEESDYPDCSPAPDTDFDWHQLDVRDARYVTVLDRLPRRGPTFTYTRANAADIAGQLIRFELQNIDGHPVSLGNIPNTNTGQNRTYAPVDIAQPITHRIDLSRIPSGRYTLQVTPGDPVGPFYWLNPIQYPDAFGVIELFATGSSGAFQFLDYAEAALPGESVLTPKTFEIRFKNRTTCWKYFDAQGVEANNGDEPPVPIRPRRPLSKKYTGYSLPDSDLQLPDAGVFLIHPKRDASDADIISHIFSEIYLNEQYKIS